MSSIKPIRNEKNFYLMNIGNNIINLGKPPIPVEILDGPIFTEIRQDFSPNAALVTRVFKASNRILRSSLQQFVLLDKIEMAQEFLLHIATGFHDSTILFDEGGVSAIEAPPNNLSSIEFFGVTPRTFTSNQQIRHSGGFRRPPICANNHGYRPNPRRRTVSRSREFQHAASADDQIRGYLRLSRKNAEYLEPRCVAEQSGRSATDQTRSVIA